MARTNRTERKQAKAAISAAKVASREAEKLAKRMPRSRRRSRLSLAVADADLARRAAREQLGHSPRRAARTAARATVRLQRAAAATTPRRGVSASGGARGRSGRVPTNVLAPGVPPGEIAERAKANAKLLKRHRVQAKQARGWAKKIAAGVVAQSIVVPTDAEAARVRRQRKP
ncbi:hypothetical protein ACDF64_05935 [Agromyces sp. MMS24-JH15]|uniref:hypothetical protein n=1 Tax=Agromyces sp. MMS24-JH15 TaxID=3243765 RepID=UPI003748EB70